MALCKIFQGIITSKCIFTATESDKFNLYGDDTIQQKRFASTRDIDEDVCCIIKTIFDDISTDDAMNIVSSR